MFATVAALTASVLSVPAAPGVAAASAPTAAPTVTAGSAVGGVEITLITGDTVRVSRDAGGRTEVDVVDAVSTNFRGETSSDGTYLYPDKAEPLLAAGVLDKELFNVEYLAENGYDDTKTKTLPVIVDLGTARSAAATRQGLQTFAAAKPGRILETIGAAGVAVDKAQAERFWESLAPKAGPRTAGVTKVWLDRKVTVTLDVSVPQIGAPQAWQAGYDGTGTTVAILDTGIDATHPDLAGKVAATQNFTTEVSAVDGHGHGTHVASTIAGNGAASGGKYKGVAPGARLVIGKVLNNAGSGEMSWIIDGMEWAAVDQDADVISMSLGGNASDGTDQMSQVVNELSESTGALFVIAAGNDGPSAQTVSTPGAAARALTVGAVDKQNKLANFSSRGPLVNSYHVKPEITAPGVGIAAARAAGTTMGTPVDASYTAASGTSMATPHVAGAAAILAQQHPDWTGDQIKTLLVGTSVDGGFTAWEQGAGRVDVARAVTQQWTVDAASISPGVLSPEKPAFTRKLTYTNTSDADVTLTLKPDVRTETGEPAPAGFVTVDSGSVTVPAGGTASATVTVNHDGVPLGVYQGALVATAASGEALRLPVGARVLPDMARLTVRVVAPADAADLRYYTPGVWWSAQRVDDEVLPWSALLTLEETADPTVAVGTALVPRGRYAVSGSVDWIRRSGSQVRNGAQVMEPEVVVTGDTEITVDLRTLVPVTVGTDRPTEPVWRTMSLSRTTASGEFYASWAMQGQPAVNGTWRYPTKNKPTVGTFTVKDGYILAEPAARFSLRAGSTSLTVNPSYLDLTAGAANTQVRFTKDADLAVASYADVVAKRDVRGKLVYVDLADIQRTDWTPCDNGTPERSLQCTMGSRFLAAANAGAAAVVATTGGQLSQGDLGLLYRDEYAKFRPIPVLWLDRPEALRLADMLGGSRPVTVGVDAAVNPSYEYKLWFHKFDTVPRSLAYRVASRDLKRVDTTYHAENAPKPDRHNVTETTHVHRPADTHSMSMVHAFDGPTSRVEYHSVTGKDVQWTHSNGYTDAVTGADRSVRRLRTITDTTSERAAWNAAPTVPGQPRVAYVPGHDRVAASCAACRQGDTLWFTPTLTGDDGSQYESLVATGERHLYRGDTEIPVGPRGVDYPLTGGADRYRMEQTFRNSYAGTPYARTVQTTWNFTMTARPEKNEVTYPYATLAQLYLGDKSPAAYQPLIFLNYEIPLALDNTAKADRPLWFTVHAGGPRPGSGRDVRGMQVEASYDDGKTWTRALVVPRGGGSFGVMLLHPNLPSTTGAVTLRVKAQDGAGNEVVQTISRAYGLSDPWAGGDDRSRPGVTP